MEKRSRRRTRDLVTQPASQGLSQNEIGCVRISMMAKSMNALFMGRIQKRKTNPLHHSHLACNTRPVHTGWVMGALSEAFEISVPSSKPPPSVPRGAVHHRFAGAFSLPVSPPFVGGFSVHPPRSVRAEAGGPRIAADIEARILAALKAREQTGDTSRPQPPLAHSTVGNFV